MPNLLILARNAKANSYSPYSKFSVGAAVEMKSGNTYTGCNVENSSYGLTICAERSAIFNAINSGETKIKRIAVSCQDHNGSKKSLMPCGACRQVIYEFSDADTEIEVDGIGTFKLEDLLPSPFSI